MKIAALDLGTNSFLCLIVEVSQGIIQKTYCDESRIVRLGQGVDKSGELSEEALQRANLCLREFREIIDQHQVEKVMAVTTSAARDAKNRDEFFAITDGYNIPLELLSGKEEAELTFLGSTYDIESDSGNDQLVVVDVGGGSTEIMIGNKSTSISGSDFRLSVKGKSLDIGAVRLTERWVEGHPISAVDLQNVEKNAEENISQFVAEFLPEQRERKKIKKIIAVAGTPTTLAAMSLKKEYSAEDIQGFLISKADLKNWIAKLSIQSLEERKKIIGLSPGRADIIVAGAIILKKSLEGFHQQELIVSTKGVRYGLAIKASFI